MGPDGPMGMPPPSGAELTDFAIYISDGKYLSDKSSSSFVSGGRIEDSAASGINIASDIENLNGLYVKGSGSQFTLSDSVIELSGCGSDDFSGVGAGAVADDGSTLILKNVNITTNGVIRCATTVMENSTLKVYDSTLIANSGPFPENYVPKMGPGMMEPPPPLGIGGSCRAHLTMKNSKSYFYNSTIIADGWGALSTDAAMGDVYLEANNCDIQVRKAGYGTYSDNGCRVVINDSKMTTATHSAIIAGVCSINLNNVNAVSGRHCVMVHNVMGMNSEVAQIGIKGGTIATDAAVILVKSANTYIEINRAKLFSKAGILIHTMLNDDPNATRVKEGETVYGIKAALENMTLEGDFVHEDKGRTMALAFIDTTLKGAITGGVYVSFDAGSKWMATDESAVVLVDITETSKIDAAAGVTIKATAGEGCTLMGTYQLTTGGTLVVI